MDEISDDVLLSVILVEEIGTIACIIQTAGELRGTMSERLAMAYYELTNKDMTDYQIRLKDEDDLES